MRTAGSVEHSREFPTLHLLSGVFALLIVTLMLVPGMGEYSMWYDE